MEFSTVQFIGFLFISFLIYSITGSKYKWIVLLLASCFFIYSFSIQLLLFTLLFSIINYILGIGVARGGKWSKTVYISGIWLNIGILVFYKYTGFLLENLFLLFGRNPELSNQKFLSLAIPLGISFYTFQSIGYLIDIKRGTKPVENNIGKFLLFILYFPKFISGPVERTGNLLPQINSLTAWNDNLFRDGLLQLIWGFIKTIVISDRLAILVNAVQGDLYNFNGPILLLNFFLQFLYLYFNFSGYTDIVLGISKLFGIKLLPNFNRPLFATSVSEYWKRWHMSLTTWCNDYIFKRVVLKRMKWKIWASVYATFLTFLIIGIWHGASWNFVVLGILQGIAINYEFFTKKSRIKYGRMVPAWFNIALSRLITFVFICFSHVFFFTKNLHEAFYYLAGMFSNSNTGSWNKLGVEPKDIIIVLSGMILIYLSEYRDEQGRKSIKEYLLSKNVLFWFVVLAGVAIVLSTGIMKGAGFIYEQF